MSDRIIDISNQSAKLHVHRDQLILDFAEGDPVSVPLCDIAAVVASQPCVSFTAAVPLGLAAHGGTLILCNERHLPSVLIMPYEGHFTQSERLQQQIEAGLPLRKRLWQQLVRAKIQAQANVLKRIHNDSRGLELLGARVRSGDPDNIEAQAARKYWAALFPNLGFRRNPETEDINCHLNYGYAIVRAVIAQAICGCGLHPSIGLNHHNRYNAFCLADDLVEPFRPVVDEAVARHALQLGTREIPLDRENKARLLIALTQRFHIEDEERTLFDIARRMASSLAAAFAGERETLLLPEWNA